MPDSIRDQISDMIDDLEALKEDATKFDTKGSKSAGTRVRQGMQVIREKAKAVRANISEIKSVAEAAKKA